MLTQRQSDLLWFIADHTVRNSGVAPSYEEMRLALGLVSRSGMHRLVDALEDRGFIRRIPHRARAIEVLTVPEGARFEQFQDDVNHHPIPEYECPKCGFKEQR